MKKGQEWTAEQLEYLKNHYPSEKAEDIGKALKRSKLSIQHKACRLGIGKDKESFFEVRSNATKGEHSGNFNGYRRKVTKGYIACYRPEHPFSTKSGLVMEHRLVVEKELGYYLPPTFDVHHINGNKQDNRIENLAILTHGAHTALHNRKDKR